MFRVACLCGLVVAAGCKTESQPAAGAGKQAGQEHNMPGIDCPLRKAGVDPSGLRPFAEVEKYIAFLDRPDPAAWQKPDGVVTALGLQGNETVFDLGAGSGYFSFKLARAVPRGKVVAAFIGIRSGPGTGDDQAYPPQGDGGRGDEFDASDH